MARTREELLVTGEAETFDPTRTPALPRWARIGLLAGGTAAALMPLASALAAESGHGGGDRGGDHGRGDNGRVADDGSPMTAFSAQSVSPDTAVAGTAVSAQTPATAATANTSTMGTATSSPNTATAATVSPNTVSPTATTPGSATTPGTATGNQLGRLFHSGLTDGQLAALHDHLGLDRDVILTLSLGELLRAAHAAGMGPHDLASLLAAS